ncbi:MAG: alpha,alpha-trehalose-phosphate synthase (UDP-forming), partial [Gaiellaceae bacterium]
MIVAANRGPVTYARTADGTLEARRGAGGLVTALRGLVAGGDLTWIASALSDADRDVAAAHPAGRAEELDGGSARVRLLAHDAEAYRRYYAEVANPTLWFTQHQLWNLPYEPGLGSDFYVAWNEGYAVVNHAFGAAVADELAARPSAPVVVHDYHLYLAPKTVRERVGGARLASFVHIPWPPPDALHVLPRRIVSSLLTSMLSCDLVGFHTERWRDNFAACCQALLGADEPERDVIRHDGRSTRLTARPISVSPSELRASAAGPDVLRELEALRPAKGVKLIVRIDRTDPSKNVLRGFEAFEHLLAEHPEHRRQVRMLALLNPSREDVPAYAAYRAAIDTAAASVNARFGDETWQPVHLDVADNFARSLAAYQLYDVLFVNPVFDGLNLVAKEGPLLNQKAGTVVLSDNAGAYAELRDHVIGVNPFDIAEQADALDEALSLADDERHRRADALRAVIEARPIEAWSDGLLRDLTEAIEADGRR